MDKEIEAKFVHANHDKLRAKLKELGAVCEHPLELMRRVVYHRDDDTLDAYFRVRDEGYRVTMTYKEFHSDLIDGVSEVETVVGDFDSAVAILDKTDLLRETYQETKRETWRLGDVEIMLDEWPWIDPFVEVEGPSEEAVRNVSEKLGFDWNDALFGGVAKAYLEQYKNMGDSQQAAFIINRRIPEMKFGMPVPDVLK
jgi:adenylate cyclase class 2